MARRRRRKISALDRILLRFEHRWQTNGQFRATVSAALALGMIVSLCVGLGVVTTVANTALAGVMRPVTADSQPIGTVDTGTGPVKLVPTYPTLTAPSLPQTTEPAAGTIPPSKTPMPTATPAPTATLPPTATPCQSNCGGGGGGGGGGDGIATGTPSPAVWKAGTDVSYTVHTSSPNVGLALVYRFPGGQTVLDENGQSTDGSGNYTSRFRVPDGIGAGSAEVWIQANFNGTTKSFTYAVPCTP